MALPSNVQTGTVIGRFIDNAGAAAAGSVTFKCSAVKLVDASASPPVTILPKPVNATLDSNGAFTIDLVATDDTDLNPTGFTYHVSFSFGSGLTVPEFDITVPQGTTVDIGTVAPVAQSGGAIIVQGMPSGGTTGQILAKNSSTSYDTHWVDPSATGGAVTSVAGKTGAVTLTKADVGLGNVDNTSDAAKPLSSAATTALAAKAPLASPAFTGAPTAPTATSGTSTTQLATTAFVANAVAGLGGGTVTSVNGQSGAVTLDAADVGAKDATYVPAWSEITSKPAVIAAGADAATARSAIGAGTSNLAIGTTSSTAMAGNTTVTGLGGIASNVTGITGASALTNMVKLTQAAYDALATKDSATAYWIVG